MTEQTPLVQVRKSKDRISESFPPDTKNNFEYIADVHKLLDNVDLSKIKKLNGKIFFRAIKEEDMIQIKKLHQEWFPLPYTESYYESIANGQVNSIVAEFEVQKNVRIIIGCLFYMSKVAKKRYLQFRFKYLFDDYYGVYITTIGVINKFRQFGVATMMMDKLKQFCHNQPRIQYIYLHIVTYNNSGIKYYEKNGYINIETKINHYDNIEGKPYDAFVYIYYLNGSSQKLSCINDFIVCLTSPFTSIINLFSKSTQTDQYEQNTNNNQNNQNTKNNQILKQKQQ